ncbi:hypothetical protein V1508DRAFT_123756 [Lipomyces doorenjongii]|uniref:uncharacterized protein n=1 Tax=Lipomyces doorenjongii TaxID=383834 RepID=UPI0034CDC6E3
MAYQQYLFTGNKGRFGPARLRRIVKQRTSASTALHNEINVQDLRQALVAFMDHHVGHADADKIETENLAHDVQSGHSSKTATMQYAIGTQDIPLTNQYDVLLFYESQ